MRWDRQGTVKLAAASARRHGFIGLESLNQASLYAVQKTQNKVHECQQMFRKFRERGIVTFTGMMQALEEDTPEYYRTLPERIEEVDPSAVLVSISIPIPGTPFAGEGEAEGRIFDQDRRARTGQT